MCMQSNVQCIYILDADSWQSAVANGLKECADAPAAKHLTLSKCICTTLHWGCTALIHYCMNIRYFYFLDALASLDFKLSVSK